jgi:hypothetical protein
MEHRMELQCQEIELEHKELSELTHRTVSNVINQVPQIMQGILVGMGGYFNVTPL